MHSDYLQEALLLANIRRGECAPNPAVGAVVVADDRVIARGFHWASGAPHAEIVALTKAGHRARGADLYVTLEPCCHQGRTPPCTQAIIKSGIARVFYASTDSNPLVDGRSHQVLKQAGIHCEQIIDPAIERFYLSYHHWQRHGLPWVTVKLAISLDGRVATRDKQPYPITRSALACFTQLGRQQSDAILTTWQTVAADDPRLNCRLGHVDYAKPLFIIDRRLRVSLTARSCQLARQVYLLHEPGVPAERVAALTAAGAVCLACDSNAEGLQLTEALRCIAQQGVQALWVETGPRFAFALWQANLCQRLLLYQGSRVIGDGGYSYWPDGLDFQTRAKSLHWQPYAEDAILTVEA